MRPEIARARKLRRDMSEPDVILWSRLRRLRDRDFRIRRQLLFRGYFLDFVCLSRRVAIEVGGSQRGDAVRSERDGIRDRILEQDGFQVLRFWAGDARRNLGWVMDRIVLALEAAPRVHGAGQTQDAELASDLPTLAASRPVPPH